jgi:hypothetical protein
MRKKKKRKKKKKKKCFYNKLVVLTASLLVLNPTKTELYPVYVLEKRETPNPGKR